MLAAAAFVFIIGITPIIIGTILYKKTGHKKTGIILRITGYIVLLPAVVIGIIMAVTMFIQK